MQVLSGMAGHGCAAICQSQNPLEINSRLGIDGRHWADTHV